MTMVEWVGLARRRGCPLLAVDTPEPLGAMGLLADQARMQDGTAWAWDCAEGLSALTRRAEEYESEEECQPPEELLAWALHAPADGMILAQWHEEYWQDVVVRQGVLNLRDPFKRNGRTLVLVGRGMKVHAGLASEFLEYEESLPGSEELEQVVRQIEKDGGLEPLAEVRRVVDALRGMTRFEAEQQCAMAASKEGICVKMLWKAKRRLVNNVAGLSYWQGNETRENAVGLEGVMGYLEEEAQGRQPVSLVVWVDESEDVLAGVEGDTSGVSQDFLGRIAGHMVDTEARGMSLYGHPGTGKSHTAKAAGGVFGCPVLALDLGAMKGSLVGQSEAALRYALQIERALVGGQKGVTMWLWTTNAIEKLPAKIRSRSQPEWFYDLPGEQEQLPIWQLYMGQYEIERQAFPDFEGWTGREIKQCCFQAWNKRMSLVKAARYVVASAVSQRGQIEARRKQASGKYLDACRGGVFEWRGEKEEGRRMEV